MDMCMYMCVCIYRHTDTQTWCMEDFSRAVATVVAIEMGKPRSSSVTVAAVVASAVLLAVQVDGGAQVPAMFVFGDSLVDAGNNNYLSSLAKANYYPYGIDFFQGSTGRFSNGKVIIDVFCEMVGIPYLPPYATPNLGGAGLVGGVNYASAAGGILEESGQHLGERYSFSRQVLNFESNLDDLRTAVGGPDNLKRHLARSLVVVIIGSNDYINNYLQPSLYPSSRVYGPEDFANLLLNAFTRQLLALHSFGLRKFFLAGLGPLGCIPNQRATGAWPSDRCVDGVNQMLAFFNQGLRTLVEHLNGNHPDSIFVYGNTYGAIGDILDDPASYGTTSNTNKTTIPKRRIDNLGLAGAGFRVIDQGCCGIGRNRGQLTCLPLQMPCDGRGEYVFWDAFHPTEAVNAVLARRAFDGPPSDCYPINMNHMVHL